LKGRTDAAAIDPEAVRGRAAARLMPRRFLRIPEREINAVSGAVRGALHQRIPHVVKSCRQLKFEWMIDDYLEKC
jgi:hypothetical protein